MDTMLVKLKDETNIKVFYFQIHLRLFTVSILMIAFIKRDSKCIFLLQ